MNKPTGEHLKTVLHVAATEGQVEIVKFLLSNGSDINLTDRNGATPLDDAIRAGNTEIAALIADKGYDLILDSILIHQWYQNSNKRSRT